MSSSRSSLGKESKQRSIKGKRDKKHPLRWLFMSCALTGVALVSATAGAMLALSFYDTPLKKTQLTPKEEAVFNQDKTLSPSTLQIPKLDRPINILILGIKVLTNDIDDPNDKTLGYHALVNSFDGLADTMLLLRFDPDKGKFTVLSIPRDTKVVLEEHGEIKINAANHYGGPSLTAKTVSNLLDGVPIDRYVRVNVQGIEKLIDALGGVDVYVPFDMKYIDESQHLYINLKQGQQHLDGKKAVDFLRFRYDQYGDIGRVQRQQLLMRSIVEKALKPNVILQASDIFSIVQSHVDTNLTVNELVALGAFASQTKRSNIQMLMLPGDFSGNGQYAVSYWLPNSDRISQMMADYFNTGTSQEQNIDPTSVQIAIQNSTQHPEAVKAMIKYLQKSGYEKIYVDDHWHEPLKVTKIVAQKGDEGSAAAIRATVGVGEVLVESTGALLSDVTIQLGEDWLEKEKAINK